MYDNGEKMNKGSPGQEEIYSYHTGGVIDDPDYICGNIDDVDKIDRYIAWFVRMLRKDEAEYDENLVLKADIYDNIMRELKQ
ncbi:MAG: hypothetical protein IJJ74_07155 [Eubacterium sp.]|nr:hypothetical protein [Eubacterium sp.]MBR1675048.1 hypothetical protein [Eubacterium sp.]